LAIFPKFSFSPFCHFSLGQKVFLLYLQKLGNYHGLYSVGEKLGNPVTTRSTTWERSMNLGDLILKKAWIWLILFWKRIAEWISLIMSRQRNKPFHRESYLLVYSSRVKEDCQSCWRSCSYKSQIWLLADESIPEMALFSMPRPVKLCVWFPPYALYSSK